MVKCQFEASPSGARNLQISCQADQLYESEANFEACFPLFYGRPIDEVKEPVFGILRPFLNVTFRT